MIVAEDISARGLRYASYDGSYDEIKIECTPPESSGGDITPQVHTWLEAFFHQKEVRVEFGIVNEPEVQLTNDCHQDDRNPQTIKFTMHALVGRCKKGCDGKFVGRPSRFLGYLDGVEFKMGPQTIE